LKVEGLKLKKELTEKAGGEIRKSEKRREALGVDHKRLLYCVNVNRTSLDHLLLGESADIDKLSNERSITPEREKGRMKFL